MGLYHVVLTTPKTSPEIITLTSVEMQQLPEIEKVDSKNEICCLKWTIYNGRRKVFISFKTDMDKLKIVVYRYRKNTYVKDTEMELKMTEYEKLISKKYICWVTLTQSLSGSLYWMKQLFINKVKFIKNGCHLPIEHFSTLPRNEIQFFSQPYPKKIFFQARDTIGTQQFPYGRWIKNFCTVERFGMETRTWTLFFATSKFSEYMQYWTMRLEQFDYKLVTDLATATWLVEVQTVVCLFTRLDYYFVFT